MRAVIFRKPGDTDVLEIAEVPRPQPREGELLVRNFATALNRADLLQRRGLYPPPAGESEILGLEFAGEVAQVGEGVDVFQRGDRVFGLVAGGGYAEFLTVDQRLALPIPDTLSFDAAAAVPEAFYVAHDALFTLAALEEGDTVLIHAGASGVGTAAIQLAAVRGITVIATAGAPEKIARCIELGATRSVNYREEDFLAAVEEVTAERGVDAVVDLVGAVHFEKTVAALAPRGRLIAVGLVGGARAEIDLGLLLRRRLSIAGTVMRSRSLEERVEVTRRFSDDVLPLLESGSVKAVIDQVLPFEDVRQAHERMEANRNVGKIVLRL